VVIAVPARLSQRDEKFNAERRDRERVHCFVAW